MKVKISYTIEHNDVPSEIEKFLENAQRQIYEGGGDLSELRNKLKDIFDFYHSIYLLNLLFLGEIH